MSESGLPSLPPEDKSGALIPIDYKNLPKDWDSEQVKKYVARINQAQRSMSTIVASNTLMTCKGDKCPFAKSCGLLEDGVAPIGKPCPIEGVYMSQVFSGLCTSLDVEENNVVDLNLVREIAQIDVMLNRISKILADEGLLQNKCVGLVDGEPVFQEDEHVLLRTQDRLRKRKEKNMQLLNSTRKDRAANRIDLNIMSPETMIKQILGNAGSANPNFINIDPLEY